MEKADEQVVFFQISTDAKVPTDWKMVMVVQSLIAFKKELTY